RRLRHDREAKSRTRLGLIEPLAAGRRLLALLRRHPGAVIAHHHIDPEPSVRRRVHAGANSDTNPSRRPLAGVVEEIASHFLEILFFAAEPGALWAFDDNGNALVEMDALERAGKGGQHRLDLADRAHGLRPRRTPRAVEIEAHLIAHHIALLE